MGKPKGNTPRYYLDACVLIDLIEHPVEAEPARTIAAMLDEADKGRVRLVTSTITVVEVWNAKREVDRNEIAADVEEVISRLWHPDGPIELITVSELIAKEALGMLRSCIERGWSKTQGNDAVHLITAKRENVDEFLTTERAMNKWGDMLGFKVCAPHFESLDQGHPKLFEN
jgi:predicted nucleic acid-binding protein